MNVHPGSAAGENSEEEICGGSFSIAGGVSVFNGWKTVFREILRGQSGNEACIGCRGPVRRGGTQWEREAQVRTAPVSLLFSRQILPLCSAGLAEERTERSVHHEESAAFRKHPQLCCKSRGTVLCEDDSGCLETSPRSRINGGDPSVTRSVRGRSRKDHGTYTRVQKRWFHISHGLLSFSETDRLP